MSEQKGGARRIENALVTRLRAWYWHLEVERLALEHFYRNNPALIESKFKASLYGFMARMIHFFMEDKALLLEPPETDPDHHD